MTSGQAIEYTVSKTTLQKVKKFMKAIPLRICLLCVGAPVAAIISLLLHVFSWLSVRKYRRTWYVDDDIYHLWCGWKDLWRNAGE